MLEKLTRISFVFYGVKVKSEKWLRREGSFLMVFLSQSDQNKQITALNLDTGSLIACLVGENKGVLVLLLNVNRDFTLPIKDCLENFTLSKPISKKSHKLNVDKS